MTKKNPPITSEEILTVYIPAQKAGKTAKEIAKQLSMQPASLNTRLHTLRRDLFNGTSTYKIGKETKTGDELATEENKAVATLSREGYFDKLEVSKKGYCLPLLARVRKTTSSLADLAKTL